MNKFKKKEIERLKLLDMYENQDNVLYNILISFNYLIKNNLRFKLFRNQVR